MMNARQRLVKAQLMDAEALNRTLDRMAQQIIESLPPVDARRLALVGMQTRGVFLAERLRQKIWEMEGVDVDFGVLDATFYRDDVRVRLRQPVVRKTDIRFDVNHAHIVLVDDVFYTGRTARAALDALLDLGRPASVRLLVLIDRGLRELPLHADLVGRYVPTTSGEGVRVRLRECDAHEGVWLVEVPVSDSP